MPDGTVGIDVDHYGDKKGAETLGRLEAKLGPLPPTVRITSRDDGISGIRPYRVPPGLAWKDPGEGIEILHPGWRYMMLPPSVHPEGRVYATLGLEGSRTTLRPTSDWLWLPETWVEALNTGPLGESTKADVSDEDVSAFLAGLPDGEACGYITKVLGDGIDELHGGGSRHDAMKDPQLRLVRAGEQGHRGAIAALGTLEGEFRRIVDADPTRARDPSEWRRALSGAVALVKADPTADDSRCCCGAAGAYILTDEEGPFDGAGEGLSDGMLCATVARDVLDGRYRWVHKLGWINWTGTRWTPVADQAVHEATRRYLLAQWRQAVKQLAEAESDERRKTMGAVVNAWRGTLNKGRIGAINSLAQGIAGILTNPADLDRHPDLLNAGNGVVDLRTGELSPHDPDLLLTKYTPVDYTPDARHPDWDAALAAIPADIQSWVIVRYGQGITGYMTPDDLLVVQDGSGENGKTTFAAGIRGATGDYYVAISHRALLGDPSQHPTELMSFRGARIALLEELPEERRLNVTRLKAIVGTPSMKARLIRHDEVEFDATHSLFLNTNHLPVVDETDHGTWRRLARLRFPYKFLKPGQTPTAPYERAGDPNLRQRLIEGRHGQHQAVLAWLVDGAMAWYATSRVMPPLPARVAADTAEWRGRSDLLLSYADDRLMFDLDTHVMCVELWTDFNEWLKAHGHREWSDRTLTSRLEEHSEFQLHDVTKTKARRSAGLSRRYAMSGPPPEQYKAWVGMRFRTVDDDREEADR